MHEWLTFSLILLGIWFVIFLVRPFVRREMFWVSLFTMPIGLTEPLFVPAYWNPPSLFDFAAKTGFDLESLIFSFAIGGIVAVLYEAIFKVKHLRMTEKEMHSRRHRFHRLAIISPALVFVRLELFRNIRHTSLGGSTGRADVCVYIRDDVVKHLRAYPLVSIVRTSN